MNGADWHYRLFRSRKFAPALQKIYAAGRPRVSSFQPSFQFPVFSFQKKSAPRRRKARGAGAPSGFQLPAKFPVSSFQFPEKERAPSGAQTKAPDAPKGTRSRGAL
jgi:hypothetical protein